MDDGREDGGWLLLPSWAPGIALGSRESHHGRFPPFTIPVVHDVVRGGRRVRAFGTWRCRDIDKSWLCVCPGHISSLPLTHRSRSRDRCGTSARRAVVNRARRWPRSRSRDRGAKRTSFGSDRFTEAAWCVIASSPERYDRAQCADLLAPGCRGPRQRDSPAGLPGWP